MLTDDVVETQWTEAVRERQRLRENFLGVIEEWETVDKSDKSAMKEVATRAFDAAERLRPPNWLAGSRTINSARTAVLIQTFVAVGEEIFEDLDPRPQFMSIPRPNCEVDLDLTAKVAQATIERLEEMYGETALD
ncbi:MAG: hypothetical protein AAFN78_01795 [Pseudomonadota bacterium]